MKRRDVVVTGIGCIGPWGIGMQGLAVALQRGEPINSPIDRSAGYHREGTATLLAACGPLDLSPWLEPQQARRMSTVSQYAVATARMALQGLGIARLATVVAEPLVRQGLLAPVLADCVDLQPSPIHAITLTRRHRLPKIQACIDHWARWFDPR